MKYLAVGLALLYASTVKASISFVGTSKENLEPIPLPGDISVYNIESVVRKTTVFRNTYAASVQAEDEYVEGVVKTESKPDVYLVRGSPVASDGSVKSSPNGFTGTVLTAYGHHQNLVIRPDDVWITILSQFSFYVNARSEKLRNKFVNHKGKKELVVTVYGYTVDNAPYDDMTRTFLDLISENLVDASIREWILPGFSTTTETDEIVAAASAMCTFQEYFSYIYAIACGIPVVTLEGTVQDWELLGDKINRLQEFDDGTGVLCRWVDLLQIIVGNMIESARNGSENNLAFWDNVCYWDSMMCGSSLLSGWITAFSFFDKDGKEMDPYHLDRKANDNFLETDGRSRYMFPNIDVSDFNANVLSCPATVDDNGTKYGATLFVGQMSFKHEPDTQTAALRSNSLAGTAVIKSRNDWALVIEKGEVELERPGPYDDTNFQGNNLLVEHSDICFWNMQPALDDSTYRLDLSGNCTEAKPGPVTSSSTGSDDEAQDGSSPSAGLRRHAAESLLFLCLTSVLVSFTFFYLGW